MSRARIILPPPGGHARQHDIIDPLDHTSGATPAQILQADPNGLPIDATNTDAELVAAVAAGHARLHDIIDILDHASGATPAQILQADANGLPVDATNTDAEVAAAVAAAHAQGTDTALGAVGIKNPPINADKVLYRDSTAADALVTSTWTQVKAFLKTYFDTVYDAIGAAAAALAAALAALAAHVAITAAGIHGSSVAAAINTLIHRDAAGRAQIVNPAVNADIDNMGARDAAILLETLARALADFMHETITAPPIHGSTVAATFDKLVHRDGAGRAQIVNPAVNADIDNLGARDAAIAAHHDTILIDADADTKVDVEEAGDEDMVRMDVAGVEAFRLSAIGILTLPKQSSAHVKTSLNQIIPRNSLTPVTHNTEIEDNQNEFDSSTGSGTAEVGTAGTTVHDDGAFAGAQAGDHIWNTIDESYWVIASVTSNDEVETTLAHDIGVGETFTWFRARFTCTEAGKYLCIAMIQFETITDTIPIASYILKNGGGGVQASAYSVKTTTAIAATVVCYIDCAANDYLQHYCKHWDAVDEAINETNSFFQVIKVA